MSKDMLCYTYSKNFFFKEIDQFKSTLTIISHLRFPRIFQSVCLRWKFWFQEIWWKIEKSFEQILLVVQKPEMGGSQTMEVGYFFNIAAESGIKMGRGKWQTYGTPSEF